MLKTAFSLPSTIPSRQTDFRFICPSYSKRKPLENSFWGISQFSFLGRTAGVKKAACHLRG
ncbi:MAG: hypothetical protein D3916_12410 [Candidatus Electrothrix sp. MAN1_4]|nr:hypothetical protein [Candidatus Electrothrix sp. MAN1_4]